MNRSRTFLVSCGILALCGGVAVAQPGGPATKGAGAGERGPAAADRPGPAPGRPDAAPGRPDGARGGPALRRAGEGAPGADGSAAPGAVVSAEGDARPALPPPGMRGGPRGKLERAAISEAKRTARRAKLKTFREESDKTREERIRAGREAARAKWGDAVNHPAVTSELRTHAWRVARLEGIQRLAQQEGDAAVATRCEALLERERARHEKHMEVLKKAGPAASGSAAGSAAPAPVAPPTPTPAPAAS